MSLKNFNNNAVLFKDLKVNNYISIYDVPLNKPITFIGFYYNGKATFPHYVLADENGNGYSLPTHLNKKFDEIKVDSEAIEEIKAGIAYFEVYEYKKGNKTYRSINVGVDEKKEKTANDDKWINIKQEELPFN